MPVSDAKNSKENKSSSANLFHKIEENPNF